MTVRRLWDAFVSLALWPATLAHEGTHLAAGYRWADRVTGYDLSPLRGAYVELDFPDGTSRWVVAAVAIMPTVVGTAFAAAALTLLWLGGGRFPDAAAEPGRWLLITAWWLAYTVPSMDDLTALTPGGASTPAEERG